jgi:L-fuconolactonase
MTTAFEKSMFSLSDEWLAKRQEDILEPDREIIDPHHHLWDKGQRYLLDEILADIGEGHNILATVHVQCRSMHAEGGDPDLAPVGETEFANGIAACAASGTYGSARVCAGIVGFADLFLGERVDRVLDLHKERGGTRFKGIRYSSPWDADQSIKTTMLDYPQHLLMDPRFRSGFARLEPHDL